MGIAILLLGLLPLAFMPDFLGSESDDDESSGNQDASSGTGDLVDEGGGLDDAHHWPPDILNPIDQDDFDDGDDDDPDQDSILSPIDEDDQASPSDGEEGDVLAPVVEDDVAARSGVSDTDTSPLSQDEPDGEEAEQAFEQLDQIQFANGSDHGPANIENFQIGQDVLQISVDPQDDDGALDVETKPSNNGQDGLVFVGGKLVAVIKDAPNTSAQDVFIEVGSGNT